MGLIHDFSEYSYSFLTHIAGGAGEGIDTPTFFETYFEFLKYLPLHFHIFSTRHCHCLVLCMMDSKTYTFHLKGFSMN